MASFQIAVNWDESWLTGNKRPPPSFICKWGRCYGAATPEFLLRGNIGPNLEKASNVPRVDIVLTLRHFQGSLLNFVARRPPGGTWSLLGRMLLIDKSFNSTTRSTDETQWRCRHLLRVVCHQLEGRVVSSWTPKRSCRSANFDQNNSRNCVLTITPSFSGCVLKTKKLADVFIAFIGNYSGAGDVIQARTCTQLLRQLKRGFSWNVRHQGPDFGTYRRRPFIAASTISWTEYLNKRFLSQ